MKFKWSIDLLKEAREVGVYGEGNNNKRYELFRVYYLNEDGEKCHVVLASKLKFNDGLMNDLDEEASYTRAKNKFLEKAPDGVEYKSIEVAKENEIKVSDDEIWE